MRIVRDLHDAAGHGVTAVSLQAATGIRAIDDGADVEEAREVLEEIKRTSRIALEDMRKLLGLLRPADASHPERDRVSLSHLDVMIDECRAAGLDVALERSGDPQVVPPLLDQTAYRIIQEALTNVLKHAGPGASATVALSCDPTSVELEVVDNGRGAVGRVGVGSRRGLIGMRERVELFGGRFSAGPVDGRGFRVFARLPLGNPLENVSQLRS
jgi:signal transduction histidine kinase